MMVGYVERRKPTATAEVCGVNISCTLPVLDSARDDRLRNSSLITCTVASQYTQSGLLTLPKKVGLPIATAGVCGVTLGCALPVLGRARAG